MSVHLVGDNNANTLTADADDQFIWGEGGVDTLNGNGLNNKLGGGNGSEADTLNGGSGDDILLIQRGNDTLNGGTDFDIARVADYERIDLVIIPIVNVEKRAFETSATITIGVNVSLGINTTSMRVGNRQIVDLDNGFSNFTGSNSFQNISANSIVADRGLMTVSSIEQYELTAFADNFFGNEQADTILGLGGNDFIEGGDGADVIDGGGQTDTASYQRSDVAVSVILDATLNSTGLQSFGHAEGDRLISIENIVGSAFDDFIIGTQTANDLHGQSGADFLSGLGGDDRVFGGDGADTLNGQDGVDSLQGGNEDDVLNGGSGADILNGGAGTDTASFAGLAGAVNATLFTGGGFTPRATEHVGATTATAIASVGGVLSVDTLTAIENLIGSSFNDSLTGSETGNNRLEGRNGDDTLFGLGGDDDLFGGANNDTLNGGLGLDELFGEDGADTLNGDGGDDILRGGAGADTLNGGSESDTADYEDKTVAVTITLGGGGTGVAFVNGVAEDTLSGIENLRGGNGADVFTGNQLGNILSGGNGNDILQGGFGFDTLDGGANTDTADYSDKTQQVALTLNAAAGANSFVNGLTEDFVINIENIRGGTVGDILFGDLNGNRIDGNGGDDKMSGEGGADTLNGGDNADQISGGGQNDTINGDAGEDRLFGDAENDTIDGGADNDLLNGGLGLDTLRGGTGSDTADYAEKTTVVEVKLDGANVVNVSVNGVVEDSLQDIENLNGGTAGDLLLGDNAINRIFGAAGDDRMRGAGGLDFLDGGLNSDTVLYFDETLSVVATLNGASQSTVTIGGINADVVVNIENVEGGSNRDFLTGDGNINRLTGNGGNDVLNGGGDGDDLIGGFGDDTYIVDNALDEITELSGQGTADRVQASDTYALFAGVGIEFMSTVNATATTAINLSGNELAQTITGNAGQNTLDGGIDALKDTLIGLGGDDRYIINSALDDIIEVAGGGTDDRASASVSYVLGAGDNIEVLQTTDAAGTTSINLTGNEIAQSITGNAGSNTLNGGLDALQDTLTGLTGNDIYVVNSQIDEIVEVAGEGTDDRAQSSVSYVLGAGDSIEVLQTTNAALTTAINLTGNELAQAIFGNAGVNTLDGGIDNLRDTLIGAGGNDIYVINSALDVIVENAGGGTDDRVQASVSFTLAADDDIEVMQTVNAGFTTAINLTGNALGQAIFGNAGDNILNGGLDTTRDTLIGAGGNDTYVINSTADVIVEAAGGGVADRVQTSVTFTLVADDDIEIFETANAAGIVALNLTGNDLAQSVTGNAGGNTLNGGLGNDILTGLAGADRFLFNTALDAANNHDAITDFSVADDTIQLDDAIFAGLAAGVLAANLFQDLALGVQDGAEVVIYNSATGDIFFDTNGAGTAGGLVLFADVSNGTALTNSDFFVV